MTNYAPTPEEVAKAFLMARTRDAHGNLLGNFTDQTSVSAEQAQGAINEALDEVGNDIGTEVTEENIGSAKRLVMLLAAANIELSYYPEQAAASNSMYDKLMARYNSLRSQYGSDEAEADIMEPTAGGTVGSFPPPQKWGTRPL